MSRDRKQALIQGLLEHDAMAGEFSPPPSHFVKEHTIPLKLVGETFCSRTKELYGAIIGEIAKMTTTAQKQELPKALKLSVRDVSKAQSSPLNSHLFFSN